MSAGRARAVVGTVPAATRLFAGGCGALCFEGSAEQCQRSLPSLVPAAHPGLVRHEVTRCKPAWAASVPTAGALASRAGDRGRLLEVSPEPGGASTIPAARCLGARHNVSAGAEPAELASAAKRKAGQAKLGARLRPRQIAAQFGCGCCNGQDGESLGKSGQAGPRGGSRSRRLEWLNPESSGTAPQLDALDPDG